MNKSVWLQAHEKMIAFVFLGASILLLALLAVYKPTDSDAAMRVIDAAMGAFTLALGGATNALFRAKQDETIDKVVDKVPPVTGEAAAAENLTVADLKVLDHESKEPAAWTK